MASRKIEDLTPRMQEKIRLFEERLELAVPGVFKRSCTYRSQEEQNALWYRGRCSLAAVNLAYHRVGLAAITDEENKRPVTWTNVSVHTSREAVDYFIQREGKYCTDIKVDTDGDHIPDWEEFGRIAAECGLEWGGTWKNPDIPHVQWKI
jgi:peptidoglycan L-alanyl-D-glutamate endopeptidase CwlK